jgi:hypothetical protein
VLRHILDPVCPRPLVSHPWQAESESATRAQRYPRPHCRAVRPRTARRRRAPRSGLGVLWNLPQDARANARAHARFALQTAPASPRIAAPHGIWQRRRGEGSRVKHGGRHGQRARTFSAGSCRWTDSRGHEMQASEALKIGLMELGSHSKGGGREREGERERERER